MLCFGLFVITGPKRTIWRTWPEYVRKGLVVAGGMLMWRSANLTSLSSEPPGPGQVNAESVLTSMALAYLFTALAVYLARNHLPHRWWERMAWMEGEAATHPHSVPVMSTMAEISGIAEVKGATALPPDSGGAELLAALERSPHPKQAPLH